MMLNSFTTIPTSRRTIAVLMFCCLLAGSRHLHAELKSGPATGTDATAFKTIVVTGSLAKDPPEELDLLSGRQSQTTVLMFVSAPEWQRPIARYLKTLDQALAAGGDGVSEVEAVAIWLTDDVEKSKQYLPKAQQSLTFSRTALTVFPGQKPGPDGWGINTDAHLTTVIVRNGKILASFAYRSTNETDVPAVIAALKKKN